MIKKTYFIKTFPIIQYLSILFLFALTVFFFYKFTFISWKATLGVVPSFQQLPVWIKNTVLIFQWIVQLAPVLILLLLLPEIVVRIKKDSLKNLFRSWLGTWYFRRFLKQAPPLPTTETHTVNAFSNMNSTVFRFNRAIGKSVIEFTQDTLFLCIRMPKNAQAQQLLKQHEEPIKEHLASLYPEYIVATFVRQQFNLWLIGTKRKSPF